MTIRSFLRNDGQFAQVDAGSISISTTTTTAFLTYLTKSTTADITYNSTSFVDGPSVAQGSSGTWAVWGTVTIESTLGTEDHAVKLWDGTTPIATTYVANPFTTLGGVASATLSGVIASPAGNLRMSARINSGGAAAKMVFNATGDNNDCTITAIRIG